MHNIYEPERILVVGGGLIGGTLAADYAVNFPQAHIGLYENNEGAAVQLMQALKEVGVSNVNILNDKRAAEAFAQGADVLDICVPIDRVADVQERFGAILPEGAVITNRGSAQAYAKAQITPYVEAGTYHFGVHPVVGRERKPGEAFKIYPGTFENQTGVIDALPENATDAQRAAHAKITYINEQLGFNVKALPVDIYDRLLGAFSHENTGGLQSLVNEVGSVDTGLGATIMRAAAGTMGMWVPIYQFNAQAIAGSGEVQQRHFENLKELLRANDRSALLEYVQDAHDFRMEWPDAREPIDSLNHAVEDIEEEQNTPEMVEQIILPVFFSVARTHAFDEIVQHLRPELSRYGHNYTDLLNSSAKNSTLAAKYNPEQVVDLMLAHKETLLLCIAGYGQTHMSFLEDVRASVDNVDAQSVAALSYAIQKSAGILAQGKTPAPRRPGGGDGFEDLSHPIEPGVHELNM